MIQAWFEEAIERLGYWELCTISADDAFCDLWSFRDLQIFTIKAKMPCLCSHWEYTHGKNCEFYPAVCCRDHVQLFRCPHIELPGQLKRVQCGFCDKSWFSWYHNFIYVKILADRCNHNNFIFFPKYFSNSCNNSARTSATPN